MARTTLRAVHADRERRRWTLSERVVDENLGGYRRVPQSREWLRLAESRQPSARPRAAGNQRRRKGGARHAQTPDQPTLPERDPAPEPPSDTQETRHQRRDDREQELIDVAWLYAWSRTGLH
jgi:hypothetical protein